VLFYPRAAAKLNPDVPVLALADLATGRVEPFETVEPSCSTAGTVTFGQVRLAVFSPDGTRLLGYTGPGGARLALRDLTTGDEHALPLPSQPRPMATHRMGGGVTWAANDLVYAVGPGKSGVLLRLTSVD
jgi:hypothetical protein